MSKWGMVFGLQIKQAAASCYGSSRFPIYNHSLFKIWDVQKEKTSTIFRLSRFSLGWLMGLEPTTFRTTIWRSNQLNYSHHVLFVVLIFSKAMQRYGFFLNLQTFPKKFCEKMRFFSFFAVFGGFSLDRRGFLNDVAPFLTKEGYTIFYW